jgi:hypothetical protein
MPLLFEDDYEYLKSTGLKYDEYADQRFLVIRAYPVPEGKYMFEGQPVRTVDVLSIIPPNYNTEGCDMFWVHPAISRADGKPIPATGGDDRVFDNTTFVRWSRHWPADRWRPKVDTIETILSRIDWALHNPDPAEA